ncbi:hypothetical protein KI809_11300 [Geobacter pelophilus]|uniref:Uncharacterized protein n=1 Tax=Geoanaerobacter pelophilus TaxID=60036 RepID=A0AAW4L5Q8_9BACT|nr:hypothetical protein [Geoanaerobacter pelophilus]
MAQSLSSSCFNEGSAIAGIKLRQKWGHFRGAKWKNFLHDFKSVDTSNRYKTPQNGKKFYMFQKHPHKRVVKQAVKMENFFPFLLPAQRQAKFAGN